MNLDLRIKFKRFTWYKFQQRMMDFKFWGFCSNKKHKFYAYFTLKNHFKPNTLFWNKHKWSDLKCCREQELDSGHWLYIIIKVKLFVGLFIFCFSVLPLVVMCLLLVLFVLKLKYWANFGWDFFWVGYPFLSKLYFFIILFIYLFLFFLYVG